MARARRVRYIRCSPAALETSDNPVVDDFYMSEEQLSNPRKRQRTESLRPHLRGRSSNITNT